MPTIKQSSLVGVLLSVVVMPFLVIPWWIRAFEFPKVILLWSLGALTGGAFLLQWVRGRVQWRPRGLIDLGILLWLGSGAIAVLVSADPFVSFWGSYERGMGFITELAVLGIFLGVRTWVPSQWIGQVPLWATLWTGLIAGTGIVSALLGVRTDMIKVGGIDLPRMSGTFGHSAFFSTSLAVLLPFALTTLLQSRRWHLKGLAAAVAMVSLIGILSSLSRGAMLGALAGSVVWVIRSLQLRAIGVSRRPVRAVSFAMVAMLIVSIFLVSSQGKLWHARLSLDASARIRLADWSLALKEGLRVPWGHGQETFWRAAAARPRFAGEPQDGISDRAHNLFLDELYAKGILGLAGLVLMLWGGLSTAWRLGAPGVSFLASLIALTTALFFLFHFSVSLLILTLLLGLLSAQQHRGTIAKIRPV